MQSLNFMRTLGLVWQKAGLNLRSEASVNYLSYAWWIIEPLLHMVVYYIVFALLLHRGGDNYVAFLLTGLIPWLWFSKSINHSMGSIVSGRQLMNQLYIPKVFFPFTKITQDAVKQVIVLTLLIIFLDVYGIHAVWNWLWLIPVVVLQLLLIIAFGLIAALIVPFVRDMEFVIPTGLQFMMFCSGIFYDPQTIRAEYHNLFFINPMAVILQCYRDVLLNNMVPDVNSVMYVFVVSIVLIAITLLLYRKLDHVLPRVVY
jgi:lipopolysaccharide transport system permease protein